MQTSLTTRSWNVFRIAASSAAVRSTRGCPASRPGNVGGGCVIPRPASTSCCRSRPDGHGAISLIGRGGRAEWRVQLRMPRQPRSTAENAATDRMHSPKDRLDMGAPRQTLYAHPSSPLALSFRSRSRLGIEPRGKVPNRPAQPARELRRPDPAAAARAAHGARLFCTHCACIRARAASGSAEHPRDGSRPVGLARGRQEPLFSQLRRYLP